MSALISSLGFTVIALLVLLPSRQFDRRIAIGSAVLCALYVGLDDLLTGLPTVVTSLGVIGDKWNWMGKLLSLVLAVTTLLALQLSPETVGLTFRQRHLKIGLIAVVLFIAWGICLGLLFKPGDPSTETLAFQATMPGLAEEIIYRGILPALLLGLLNSRGPVEGIPWTVIIATSLLFGAWHGLRYSDGAFSFELLAALFPTLGSIAGGWLRFKTGSLVMPILGHNFANVAFHVAGGMAA
jgi:membrane protease YdiL (CAAX protease family)